MKPLVTHIFLFVFLVSFNHGASGLAASGAGAGVSAMTTLDLESDCPGADCILGFGDPFVVEWDPNAGPWIKQFSGLSTQTFITIHEFIVVGGNVAFTDWHEELGPNTPPGWGWNMTNAGIFFTQANGQMGPQVPGLQVSLGAGPNGNPNGTIWFDFDPLIPGTAIEIWKELALTGPPMSGSITIIEFPTVPIPTAIWMLGSALLGLFAVKRRV